jgi:hypothetical protein
MTWFDAIVYYWLIPVFVNSMVMSMIVVHSKEPLKISLNAQTLVVYAPVINVLFCMYFWVIGTIQVAQHVVHAMKNSK